MLETATLSLIATALGSFVGMIATKAIEKTGDNLGENIYERFINKVEAKSPETAKAIKESAEKPSEKPLDYGATIIDVQAWALEDPDFQNIIDELAVLAENIQEPIIKAEIGKAKAEVQNIVSNHHVINNTGKIGNVVYGGTVNIDTMNF